MPVRKFHGIKELKWRTGHGPGDIDEVPSLVLEQRNAKGILP